LPHAQPFQRAVGLFLLPILQVSTVELLLVRVIHELLVAALVLLGQQESVVLHPLGLPLLQRQLGALDLHLVALVKHGNRKTSIARSSWRWYGNTAR
jgi:hypothetical protein